MKVFNTLTGKKEELIPLNPPKVNIYVCGPTTYNYIHLGNARPLVVFDTLRRYLTYKGYQVRYVQNFTDIDDKIINRANQEGVDSLELAERYIGEYFADADALGIERADFYPRVSEHIEDIIKLIKVLMDKGFAYETEGDVYFRVNAFPDYGKLSGRSREDMLAGARIEVDRRKEDAADFAWWKKAKEGEPFWNSPWGKGRPGWHIECSTMSIKYLGETLDIHGGGADLIFPHHENEIAQSEAATGQAFSRYWMHNGFITVNKEKMSKSLGNFFILRDILQQYSGEVVRYYLIATHYRSPLDFDDTKLVESKKALGRLKTTLTLIKEFKNDIEVKDFDLDSECQNFLTTVEDYEKQFLQAMDDDLNTAKALSFLFEMSHLINSFLAQHSRSDLKAQAAVRQAEKIYRDLGNILGIFIDNGSASSELVTQVLEIFAELRQMARREKDYSLADQIREILKQMEISVEDTPEGTKLRYEKADLDKIMARLIQFRVQLKNDQKYHLTDFIRERLKQAGIILEDTREGARWKFAEA